MKKIRILIVDDQTLMRDGLKTILDLEEDMEVVGTAENGLQACELARNLQPDLILMDIRMPEMNGVESARQIKQEFPAIIILMLTTFDDEEYIVRALSYGANGYLLKDIPGDRLIQSVRDAAAGNLIMPSAVAVKLASRLNQISQEQGRDLSLPYEQFSIREKEIAALMAQGLTNSQIARHLCISEGTAKNYISIIYSKIGISDRTKAVLFLKRLLKETV